MDSIKEQINPSLLERYKIKHDVNELLAKAIELAGSEEVENGLLSIIRLKEAQAYKQAYWENINKPTEYEQKNAEELQDWFKDEYFKSEGKKLIIDEYSKPIIDMLCLYFSNDPRFEDLNDNYSLNKGLFLQGNVGTGKSSFLKIFQQNQKHGFRFISCPSIANEFKKGGVEKIEKFGKLALNQNKQMHFGQEKIGWLFDDLGFETQAKNYGNTANVMVDIIQTIYNNSEMNGKVHLTTNLTADDIDEAYGRRIRSRMKEMFNVICYDVHTPDRRK